MNSSWNDLQDLWTQQPAPAPDTQALLAWVEIRANSFDRAIRRRNRLELAAALIIAIVFAIGGIQEQSTLTRIGYFWTAASGLWISYFITRHAGNSAAPSPDQSLAGYREALLRSYDRQLQVLRSVKYWYLMPPYIGMTILSAGRWQSLLPGQSPAGVIALMAGTTALYLATWWLNEVRAARYLQKARRELLAAEEESCNAC